VADLGKVVAVKDDTTAPPTNIQLYDDKIVVPFEIAPGVSQDREVDLLKFVTNMSSQALIDTNLLPVSGTGLLALRQLGKYRQITFQLEAGKNLVTWGATEGQQNKPTYYVASPYRIVIADIFDGDLLGARMFYSTEPISSPDQVLYHINLPNVNCLGYGGGNGVGWLCLYLRESWKQLDIASQIHAIVERAGGGEAYNDANMSSTDGARLYKKHKTELEHLYDANAWQKYTEENGWEWVLDPENWIPIMVNGADDQDRHVFKDGVPYTIDMAMRGSYKAYYTDGTKLKPINAVSREDTNISDSKNHTDGRRETDKTKYTPFSLRSMIERSISMGEPYGVQSIPRPIIGQGENWTPPTWAAKTIKKAHKVENEATEVIDFAPQAIGICKISDQKIYEGAEVVEIAHFGMVLKPNVTDELFVKDKNGTLLYAADCILIKNQDEEFYIHKETPHGVCSNCGTAHIITGIEAVFFADDTDPYAFCTSCTETAMCAYSGMILPKTKLHMVRALNPATGLEEEFYISQENFPMMTRCLCNLLKPIEHTNQLAEGSVCAGCVKIANDGTPSYECGITINTPQTEETV